MNILRLVCVIVFFVFVGVFGWEERKRSVWVDVLRLIDGSLDAFRKGRISYWEARRLDYLKKRSRRAYRTRERQLGI